LGRINEGKTAYQRALPLFEALAAGEPAEETQFRNMVGARHNNLGILHETTGELQEAEQAHKQALVIREKLADTHPNDGETQMRRGATLCNLGNIGWTPHPTGVRSCHAKRPGFHQWQHALA
jgi:hypothetical protein